MLLFRKVRQGTLIIGLSLFYFLLISTPFISEPMTRDLERRYSPLTDFEQFDDDERIPVIVLGNLYGYDPDLPENSRLSNTLMARVLEGIRVYRELPDAELVTSGAAFEGTYAIAEGAARFAKKHGVEEEDIVRNTTPTNTCTEAQAFIDLYGEGSRVIIATPATHIPRAMMLFEQVGADPIAAPTDYEFKNDPAKEEEFNWKPGLNNINRLEKALKEHIGMVWGRYSCE